MRRVAGVMARSDVPDVAHVGEGEREAEVGVDALHQAMGTAVDVGAADDVVTRLEELEDRIERRESGAEGEAEAAALEARDVALERLAGRVLGAGVLVALVPAEPFLGVGRGLVDRRHDRTRRRDRGAGRRARPAWQGRGSGLRRGSGSWAGWHREGKRSGGRGRRGGRGGRRSAAPPSSPPYPPYPTPDLNAE